MRPRRLIAATALALGLLGIAAPLSAQQPAPKDQIEIVEIEGLIDPPVERYLATRIQMAMTDDPQAIVVRLDSSAAAGTDVRDLAALVRGSVVPLIVWVAPRGADVDGPVMDIAEAADAVYVADAARIGEAEGSAAVTARLADGTASSLAELLQAIDGVEFTDVPDPRTMESWDDERGFPDVLLRFHEMPLWDRLLHAVTTPEAALFLILLGAFGPVFEIYNPGIGIAALLGAVLLGLGFYALDVLPTNWAAVALIFAALAALIYDVHVAGFGIWTIGGLAGIGGGALWLFPGPHPALDVEPLVALAAVVLTIVFFVSVMTAALRVRLRRPITESDGIVGSIAEAQTDIAPEGTVLTNGTLWRARTMETGIAAGARVEVKATEGTVLLVEPWHED